MNSKTVFAISYFSTVLGECCSVGIVNDLADIVAWHYHGISGYVASIDHKGALIDPDLPADIYYKLVGYCVEHDIERL